MKKNLTHAESKRKNRRKKILKRRLFISFFVLLLLSAVSLTVLFYTKFLPVKTVTVNGNSLYTSSEIIKQSGIKVNAPLFGISKKRVSDRILKKFSYIESVSVKKSLPDTVSIKVTEADDYYAFKTDDGYYGVSKNGRVLSLSEEQPQNTVTVNANNVTLKIRCQLSFQDEEEKQIFEFLTTYPESKGIKVDGIDITDKVHLTVYAESRFKILLGNKENLDKKINHLAGMIEEIGDRNGTINLEMWSESDSKGTFIAEN